MTTNTYVGAIDQGTTGTQFIVFDHSGRQCAHAYERHERYNPQPNWVEYDPIEIWKTTKTVVTRALEEASIDANELAAIGIANQRETTVAWDAETGVPVRDAIGWQDRRTSDRIERLQADGKSEWVREVTGLQPDAYFSASKVEWLLSNTDASSTTLGIRDRAEAGEIVVGTVDSWLVYNLTGEHVTDVTNASQTMLYDIRDQEWSEDLLEEFDVPRAALPEVRPSSDDDYYGYTDADGFLNAQVPVTAALGDQQAALFGQNCFDEGDAKNTYGTGSFFLMHTGETVVDSDHGLLATVAFQRSGEPVQYALEGPVFSTGTAIEWLDDASLIEHPSGAAALAKEVDSTDGVYVVPAFYGLGAPHWDENARGTIVGITRGTRREHIVRATLESIAYQTRDVATAMKAEIGVEVAELRVGGGAAKNNFLCQLQADVLQTDVVRPYVNETTALGAAYAAGLAVGYWESIDDLRDNWHVERVFTPELDPETADRQYDRWNDAVERSLGWAMDG